jgi:pimeloyl-ACP methyl ester carboxylesterase
MRILSAAILLLISLQSSRAMAADTALSMGEHHIDLGDVTLHYVVRGRGPLLFVTSPGWGVGSKPYQIALAPLERNLKLVYIDTRGSGDSTQPADRSHMTQAYMADDIERLRQKLGVEAIDLLGHSDGGIIAIEYALRHPDHARKILLVSTGVLGDRESKTTDAFLELWSDDPQYRDAVKALREADWEKPDLTDEEFGRSLFAQLPLYLADPSRHLKMLQKATTGGRLSAYAVRAEFEAQRSAARDQSKDAPSIRARTLILNGTVDFICPYGVAQRLHAAIPHAELHLYANKGHMLWIEDRPRFFADVLRFMN